MRLNSLASLGRTHDLGLCIVWSEVAEDARFELARGILSHMGGFAEYVCVPETALAPMPAGMTYQEAAACPRRGPSRCRASKSRDGSSPGKRC